MPAALLSVSDKTGLVDLGRGLAALGWDLIATAGTWKVLRDAGVPAREVADLTGAPEVLGGRVKTLHPAIFAGILARGPGDADDLAKVGAVEIALVAVDLYPFETRPAVETIDIGGVALLRAAAKASDRVLAVSSPSQYGEVLGALRAGGDLGDLRRRLAAAAWARVAAYDAAIARWAGAEGALPLRPVGDLRYGENPHQAGGWFATEARGVHEAEVLGGKPLSANNVADVDAAAAAVRALAAGPLGAAPGRVPAAIIKHTNPCGAGVAPSAEAAYRAALRGDPEAAFGGVVALGAPVDAAAAAAIAEVFTECVVAPAFDDAALEILRKRKNLRILRWPGMLDPPAGWHVRGVAGGLLLQAWDEEPDDPAAWKVASRRSPTDDERTALDVAWRLVRVVKSNAIVLAWPEEAAAIGAGQMSRVDAARIAVRKLDERRARGAVPPGPLAAASDAFLPFPDTIEILASAGATALVQPGGSRRDSEVTAAADRLGVAMVFTGRRHFRH